MKIDTTSIKRESFLAVALICSMILLRNFVLFSDNCFAPYYNETPLRLISPTVRPGSNRCNSKVEKSIWRNLFFNHMRNVHIWLMRSLLIKGRVVAYDFYFICGYTTLVTVIYQVMPKSWFAKYRFVWALVLMEYYTKHAYDLIMNRN